MYPQLLNTKITLAGKARAYTLVRYLITITLYHITLAFFIECFFYINDKSLFFRLFNSANTTSLNHGCVSD